MGNKRTYRSTPEPRFVKRALETASGKNIDDAISKFDKITYNSDTNTVEIGSNLYVNGDLIVEGADKSIFRGAVSFLAPINVNGELQFSINASILLNDNAEYDFIDDNGRTAHLSIGEDYQEGNILTDTNTKTLFGNQNIYGSGNIDLYRHQLKVKVGENAVYFVITSSSNLKVTSLQDLTTVTKATNGYFTLAMRPGETNDILLVTYNNNVWGSSIGAITAITEDVVTTM